MSITLPPLPAKPWAYFIYISGHMTGYVVEDLDDATDDLTNCECEITPLFPAAVQADRVPMSEAKIIEMLDEGYSGTVSLVRMVEAHHDIGVEL